MPLFSIIIPTFNRKEALIRCLTHLFAQTESNFEVIVVDDGSTDQTENLFSTIFTDPRLRYLKQTTNQGAYHARNIGIQAALGDYLMHWDSDDDLAPNALERLSLCFQTHPDAEVVCAPARFQKQGENLTIAELSSQYFTYERYLQGLLPENSVLWAIKRTAAEGLTFAAPNIDFVYFHRLIRAHVCFYLNESLGVVHLLSDSLSETLVRRRPHVQKSILRARALAPFLAESASDFGRIAPRKYGEIAYGAAIGSLLDAQTSVARKLALTAWNYAPQRTHLIFLLFTYFPGASHILHRLFCFKQQAR